MRREDRLIEELDTGDLFNKYIDDMSHCPYCGSSEVEFLDDDYVYTNHYNRRFCSDCDAEWDDVYKIVAIYEIAGPDPDLLKRRQDNEEVSQQCS
jgi:hypothetical protein